MKIIEKPNTKRLCPRCQGQFEFNVETDLKFTSGGKHRIGHWYVECPFCHYPLNAWGKENKVYD